MMLGNAAALGGFILSVVTFFGVKIKSDFQIMLATASLPITVVGYSTTEILKTRFVNQTQTQLEADQHLIDSIINDLKILEMKAQVPGDSYLQILNTLNLAAPQHDSVSAYLASVPLQDCIQRNSAKKSNYEHGLKYSTHFLNGSLSLLTGASSIYIQFIVPAILKEEQDNERIALAANICALTFALYSGISSIINSNYYWQQLDNKRLDVAKSIHVLFSKLSHESDENIPSNIKTLMTDWNVNHPTLTP